MACVKSLLFLLPVLLTQSCESFVMKRNPYTPRATRTQLADYIRVPRTENGKQILYQLFYTYIEREGSKEIPVVTIHGGPGIPSTYLWPLQDVIDRKRNVLYHDQLGCGKSDRPKKESSYSIAQIVEDLEILLRYMGFPEFHLYGHSFGGVIAYEYLKKNINNKVRVSCITSWCPIP